MDFFESVFDAFFGSDSADRERPRETRHVDRDGHVYERNWFSGTWEPKQGLFETEVELDLFGNPRVDRDWLGDPVADRGWFGDQMHTSLGEPLFRLTDDD